MNLSHPDPHQSGTVWYWSTYNGLMHSVPDSNRWVCQCHHPLPETPERLALWIALRLEVV